MLDIQHIKDSLYPKHVYFIFFLAQGGRGRGGGGLDISSSCNFTVKSVFIFSLFKCINVDTTQSQS